MHEVEKNVLPGDVEEARLLVKCFNDCLFLANFAALRGDALKTVWYRREMHRCSRDLYKLYERKHEDDRLKSVEKLELRNLNININLAVSIK